MIKFFEIFPQVNYIYENTMSSEVYDKFFTIISPLMKDKKFPIVDVCRVFDIILKISPYFDPETQNF